ncbi:MAG: alpha/beta fold hydrolase [Anaerolineae bacterium]
MSETKMDSGLAKIGRAHIYFEVAGSGQPFVMIHAGVADSRQWNNEFESFSKEFRVVRYDMRGYGRSEPVDGEFTHLEDLTRLLDYLDISQPSVLMGCSMGGGLAMDFALTHPSRVKTLIMVDAGPSGLKLDVPTPAKSEQAEKAYNDGDLDLVAEIETQIWFDGMGRTPDQVNQAMRLLAYEMNRNALSHDAKRLGKRLPDSDSPAAGRLTELEMPVLVVVGAHDTPFMLAAGDYIADNIRSARKVILEDAAHLCNMDQSAEFQRTVNVFLDELAGGPRMVRFGDERAPWEDEWSAFTMNDRSRTRRAVARLSRRSAQEEPNLLLPHRA